MDAAKSKSINIYDSGLDISLFQNCNQILDDIFSTHNNLNLLFTG